MPPVGWRRPRIACPGRAPRAPDRCQLCDRSAGSRLRQPPARTAAPQRGRPANRRRPRQLSHQAPGVQCLGGASGGACLTPHQGSSRGPAGHASKGKGYVGAARHRSPGREASASSWLAACGVLPPLWGRLRQSCWKQYSCSALQPAPQHEFRQSCGVGMIAMPPQQCSAKAVRLPDAQRGLLFSPPASCNRPAASFKCHAATVCRWLARMTRGPPVLACEGRLAAAHGAAPQRLPPLQRACWPSLGAPSPVAFGAGRRLLVPASAVSQALL